MPYTTLVAGTTITASWANASVRDQTVTPFASTSARSSAVTSPVNGMVSYITGSVQQLHVYDGTAWVPTPGTLVARGERTSTSTATTTEQSVLRVDSVSVTNGRTYWVACNPLWLSSTVAGDVIAGRIRVATGGSAATTGSTVLGEVATTQPTLASFGVPLLLKYVPGSTTTASFLLTVVRGAGTGNCTINVSANHPSVDLMIFEGGYDPTDTGVDL